MANQTLVRHINERRLLSALRVSGPLPRAELARRLSLTRASVTGMVDDLTARNLVRELSLPPENPARRDVGRPGIDIALNPDGAHFLGVEIGVGVLRFALMDLAASVIDTHTVPLPSPVSPEIVVALIATRLAELRQSAAGPESIRAVGITVPGLVRSDGFVINLPILGWKQVHLGALLSARIDIPCHANAAAFGHIYADPRAGDGVIVYLKIGTGCGGAVIIDNKLLRGSHGLGTEFGHLRIAGDGPLCSCGQRGCLETYVNLKALQRYVTSEDVDERRADPGLPADIAARARKGDAAAEQAIAVFAGYLTRGLIDIVNLFNPDEIVFGGTMLPILDPALALIRAPLAKAIVPGMPAPVLTVSRIGAFECAIGAAALAHHEEFDLTNLDLRT